MDNRIIVLIVVLVFLAVCLIASMVCNTVDNIKAYKYLNDTNKEHKSKTISDKYATGGYVNTPIFPDPCHYNSEEIKACIDSIKASGSVNMSAKYDGKPINLKEDKKGGSDE